WTATTAAVGQNDGATRLLWTHANGGISLWTLTGPDLSSADNYGPYPGWTATALAMTQSYKPFSPVAGSRGTRRPVPHLLWAKTTGEISIWTINTAGNPTAFTFGPF